MAGGPAQPPRLGLSLCRATVDTNVIVSALVKEGVPLEVLRLATERQFSMQLSSALLSETLRVLRDKFGWAEDRVKDTQTFLQRLCDNVVPHLNLTVVTRDPDDNRVLECAQASRSDYVVTGDKDLLSLQRLAGADIVTPAEFVQRLVARKAR